MDPKTHWEHVYRIKPVDEVSWFQREATISLELIRRASNTSAAIIDVGGGASTLVDGLLEAGYTNVSVLDVSSTALAQAKARLGETASHVQWIEANILTTGLREGEFDLWHDRAVFHFLTDAADRKAYIDQVRRALRPGGHVVVATFAEDGPTRCSGLPIVRYSCEALHAEFDGGFRLVESVRELHSTPTGAIQAFVYCVLQLGPEATRRAA